VEGVVYKCTNSINGKVYIGKTTSPFKSYCKKHIQYAFNKVDLKRGQKRKFYHAIRKYGAEIFKWEIIETCNTPEELNDREIYWISFFNSFKNGYNNTAGGDGAKGMIPYKRTKKIRQKISRALTGHKRSEESKKSQAVTMSGPNHPLSGIGHKPESINKMKKAKKGLKNPNAKIYEFISPKGKIFIVKASFNKFCLKHHLWHNALTKVSRGLKENHKGWKCRVLSSRLPSTA
jgi:group I intron endonuclease